MKTVIRSVEDYRSILSPFIKEQVNHLLNQHLEQGLALAKIMISVNDITPKNWNGELFIHFLKNPDVCEVVNQYISHSGADEIFMEGNNSLRLWWD